MLEPNLVGVVCMVINLKMPYIMANFVQLGGQRIQMEQRHLSVLKYYKFLLICTIIKPLLTDALHP